jgi:hypothetical protein
LWEWFQWQQLPVLDIVLLGVVLGTGKDDLVVHAGAPCTSHVQHMVQPLLDVVRKDHLLDLFENRDGLLMATTPCPGYRPCRSSSRDSSRSTAAKVMRRKFEVIWRWSKKSRC